MTAVFLADEYNINNIVLPKDSVVIDIGANIGTFAVHISRKAGKILSYEPTTENYKMLLENIKINKLDNVVNAFNLAVYGSRRKIKIYFSKIDPGQHSVYGNGNNYEEVEAITLKQVFDDNDIDSCDLLKIDTEGSEYEILYNLPDSYFLKIKRIYLEYHNINKLGLNNKNNNTYNAAVLKSFLASKGFEVSSALKCLFANKNE